MDPLMGVAIEPISSLVSLSITALVPHTHIYIGFFWITQVALGQFAHIRLILSDHPIAHLYESQLKFWTNSIRVDKT